MKLVVTNGSGKECKYRTSYITCIIAHLMPQTLHHHAMAHNIKQ